MRRKRKLVASLGWMLLKFLRCRFCKVSTAQHFIDIVAKLTHSCEDEGIKITPIPSSILPQRDQRNKTLSPSTDTAFSCSQDDYITMTGDTEPQITTIKEMTDMALPTLDGPSRANLAKGGGGSGVLVLDNRGGGISVLNTVGEFQHGS